MIRLAKINLFVRVFERTPEGDEHALDPGWWLKQQIRSDWNRIKLDTFIPIYLPEPAAKTGKKKTTEPITATEAGEPSASPVPAKKPKQTKSKASSKKPAAHTATSNEQEAAAKDVQGDALQDAATLVQSEATTHAPAASEDGKADSTPAQESGDVA